MIELVGGIAGSLIGAVGGLVKNGLAAKTRRDEMAHQIAQTDQTIRLAQAEGEIEGRKAAAAADVQLADRELEAEIADRDVLARSHEAAAKLASHASQPVIDLIAATRPVLTFGLVAISAILTALPVSVVGPDGVATGLVSPEGTATIYCVTATAVNWWFCDRPPKWMGRPPS